jgi:hypothetical protein
MTGEKDTVPRLENAKRPYRAPNLHEYGDIREITQQHGRNGGQDSGVGVGNDHTQP